MRAAGDREHPEHALAPARWPSRIPVRYLIRVSGVAYNDQIRSDQISAHSAIPRPFGMAAVAEALAQPPPASLAPESAFEESSIEQLEPYLDEQVQTEAY